MLPENPTVSIFINCKNGSRSVRRCIEGVLAQTYPHVKLLFQDGGSTDGTLDIVHEYMKKYPGRIHLNQEPDSCPEEGFFRALKACEGDIIGSSMADEELLPEAAALAVEHFKKLPEAGAIYGDVYVTDIDGKITGTWVAQPFTLEHYLCCEISLPFAASFFRREALLEAGLLIRNWTLGIGELELWLMVAMKHPIHYVPGIIAKFAFHPDCKSHSNFYLNDSKTVSDVESFLERFFLEPDIPAAVRKIKRKALAGIRLSIAEVLLNNGQISKAQTHILKALEHEPNELRLSKLSRRLFMSDSEWDIKMLRTHISAHLEKLPFQRIICYGAGNAFIDMFSSGVFGSHEIVAVVDNFRSEGECVCGIPVIRETDLGRIAHDIIVITSLAYMHKLRTSAMRWVMNNSPHTLVI